jgi:hypothetical protein
VAATFGTKNKANRRLCGKRAVLYLEPGRVQAECTEPEGHPGTRHYDKAFAAAWDEAA